MNKGDIPTDCRIIDHFASLVLSGLCMLRSSYIAPAIRTMENNPRYTQPSFFLNPWEKITKIAIGKAMTYATISAYAMPFSVDTMMTEVWSVAKKNLRTGTMNDSVGMI